MCGRYVIFSEKDISEMNQIIREINQKYGDGNMATGEIYPTNQAPVFVAQEGGYGAELMTWGLPQFKGSGVIINARAETAQEKRTFKSALEARRCVIPSTGFYEWTHAMGRAKEKYLFNMPGSPMLYMAGLYNPVPGELSRYVILTTAANDSMSDVHDRMPVILRSQEIGQWITQPNSALEFLHRKPPELVKRFAG